MTVILNGKDEPRVVLDVRQPGHAIRERALDLLESPDELDELLDTGAEKAREVARPNLTAAWDRMGLG